MTALETLRAARKWHQDQARKIGKAHTTPERERMIAEHTQQADAIHEALIELGDERFPDQEPQVPHTDAAAHREDATRYVFFPHGVYQKGI